MSDLQRLLGSDREKRPFEGFENAFLACKQEAYRRTSIAALLDPEIPFVLTTKGSYYDNEYML